ncbi:MAG: polyprenyl synthetase family protein [Anaerolineales bacterium]|nr:polyprenyl synthetase family protein [Anaerolineales bacterium]
MIDLSQIGTYFWQQPEVAAWPELVEVWQHYAQNSHSWLLPELACRAVGGDVAKVVPVVTAVACCHISIVLVDDILDDDPKGLYRRWGAGVAANFGLAFQSAAYRILQQAATEMEWDTAVQQKLLAELVHLNLQTAHGQHLDVQEAVSEEHYWATVAAKSTPYYGAGFYLGAVAGGANNQLAGQLRQFGQIIGAIIQISDDLADVYQTPASPDWQRGTGNLAILYARLADHADQARFEAILPQTDKLELLEEAQQILLQSGAVSYCVYHLLQKAREARAVLNACHLVQPGLLQQFLAERVAHLFELLESSNMPLPAELAAELLG